ncbi:MAG: hypothetical protein H6703_16950 [Myxococcales bacterium]|nr:hypothetical protein [Myxococcales bacterium]MCB9553304.1 hypothetical protein [Myxococcales bacterium]
MTDMPVDPPGPEPEPEPGMDMEPDLCGPRSVFEPDPEYFAAEIAQPLYIACGVCHNDPEPRPGAPFTLVRNGPAGLTPEQNQLNVAECLSFVDAADPAGSDLIDWHPNGHPGYIGDGPLKDAIIEWIENGTRIVEPEPGDCGDAGVDGPDGGNPVRPPCEALLGPEGNGGARSQTYRDDFEREDPDGVSHNDVLVGSCARNGGCHALAGEGGDYWLLEEDSECAIEWNFVASQIYIDWLNPLESPLLTQPRDPMHGGRDVFRGSDDSRHVRLLNWIRAEVVRSTRGN